MGMGVPIILYGLMCVCVSSTVGLPGIAPAVSIAANPAPAAALSGVLQQLTQTAGSPAAANVGMLCQVCTSG